MDKFVSAGKDFVQSQMQQQQQGHDSSGSNKAHGDEGQHDDGMSDAHHQASKLAGSSGSSDMFSQVLGAVGKHKDKIAKEDIDEEDVARKHKETYQEGSGGDANSLGVAAAMQALKKSQGGGGSSSSGGKQSQGDFLALAMSEASKLFDDKSAKGQVSGGASKQDTIHKACEMALKFYLKSQAQQQGGLAGLATKFLN